MPMSGIVVIVILCAIFIPATVKNAREYERLAVFRLGRYMGVKRPGLLVVIPFVDRVIKVNLNHDIPEWQGLTEHEIEERVSQLVLTSPK